MQYLPLRPSTKFLLWVLPYFPGRAVGWGYQGVGVTAGIFPIPPPLFDRVLGDATPIFPGIRPLRRGVVVGYYFLMEKTDF